MQKFPIKGYEEGLLISIGEGNWEDLQATILQQIDAEQKFFSSAKLAIDVGERDMRAAQLSKLRDVLSDREIKLFAVLSTSKKTNANVSTLGLATRKALMQRTESKLTTALMDGEPGLVIQKTVRSGAIIEYDGHVIVNGDLNPGAEIRCSGSVFIWGKLRGTVSAGYNGAADVVVCAMGFDPVALRIANIEIKNNKLISKLRKKPVKISVVDDNLVLDYWES